MTISKLSLFASSALIGAAVLVGCGTNDDFVNVKGKLIDGYVSGATLTLAGETTTSTIGGNYSLSINAQNIGGTLVARGGIDESTGEDFDGTLKAVSVTGTTVILTPLSTMVVDVLANDSTRTQSSVESSLATALGLGSSFNYNTDLVADPAANAAALKAVLQVQKFAEVFDATKVSSSSGTLLLANQLLNSNNTNINTAMTAVANSVKDVNAQIILSTITTSLSNIATITDEASYKAVAIATDKATEEIETKIETAKANNQSLDTVATEVKNNPPKLDKVLPLISAGSTLTIGTDTITLEENKDFTKTINTNNKSITDFYAISFAKPTSNKAIATAVDATLKIVISNNNNEKVEATIAAKIKTASNGSDIEVTVPSGSKVTVAQTNLATLQSIIGDSAEATTNSALTLNGLDFNINTVLSTLNNAKIPQAINALNSYLSKKDTYDVKVTVDSKELALKAINGKITVTN